MNYLKLTLGAAIIVVSWTSSSVAVDVLGRWRGTWSSHTTGHHGPVRAVVRERGDGQYDARFFGRFALVIPFTYKVTMTPMATGGCESVLVAEKRLGPLMGSYRMSATVSGSQLNAHYQSAKDHGVFEMSR